MTRTPTVRRSELEIVKRKWPLLVAINHSAVCHITDDNGILRANHPRHKNAHDQLFNVTRCGRALKYTIHERQVPEDEFLCARCGMRIDFENAQVAHDVAWEDHLEEQRAQDAIAAAMRQLERDRKTAVLEALYEALAWDYEVGRSWSPVTDETDRGQQVIYLNLDTHLPGVITAGERNHAYPHLYRAVVHLELIPEDES